MATATTQDITLTTLLPSPYILIYSIPLLIAALLLTFAGAFLTLDRTRTFAPQAPVQSLPGGYETKKITWKLVSWWRLEGGLGGLAGGWVFGEYLATFLSLLIMNRTSDPPLKPVHFLIIHLVISLLSTAVGGRFRLAALTCIGTAGGVSFALIISVVLHPALLTRLIFVAIITPLFLIAVLLPLSRTQHAAVRAAAASAGAFGTIVSIALLAHIPAWANVWERLWFQISPSNDWGTGAERGLSAAACVMLAAGIATDWTLQRFIGENPDQKWDSYLAQYASSLPNGATDRSGSFQPILSLWQRLFHPASSDPIIFPSDADLKTVRSPGIPVRHSSILKTPRKRSDVRFQPLGGYSDSDTDSDPEWDTKAISPRKPWLQKPFVSSVTLSGATLYGSDSEHDGDQPGFKRISSTKASFGNYSDSDGEDITTPHSTPLKRNKSHRDEPGWKPEFLSRHEQISESPLSLPSLTTPKPPGAVPMTPSLIRAIDRIAVAQADVYGSVSPPPLSPPPLHRAEPDEKWDGFWVRVRQKADMA